MRRSEFLLPTTKETAAHAEMLSHKLMLQAGMIASVASGIYTWLPLGVRVLQKISDIIREEQDRVASHEVLMPMIQPGSLWEKSGRIDAYGPEMLKMKDRHDNTMLFGPTAEEIAVDVCSRFLNSYKDCPLCVFQIQWKFRDEIRPRFGVMRAREFLMKDAYSFDVSPEAAYTRYKLMATSYFRTFKRMDMIGLPVRADSGAIGGNLSHEFAVLCDAGESPIYYKEDLKNSVASGQYDVDQVLKESAYAEDQCPEDVKDTSVAARAIEVGHIFYFGAKYSQEATFRTKDNELASFEMGSYGIGVSRLAAALIECHHDDQGIVWPKSVAPFQVVLVGLGLHKEEVRAAAEGLYGKMLGLKIEVLYDDREDAGAGKKLADAYLIGCPKIVVMGPKSVSDGALEVHDRATGKVLTVSLENMLGDVCSYIN